MTSAESGGSVTSSAYLALEKSPMSSMLQQQGVNFARPTVGGRPFSSSSTSQRPFKQSMSIDHHSIGQYHHLHHQPSTITNPVSHHSNSSAQSISPHFEPSDYHQQQNYPTSAVLSSTQRAGLVNLQGPQILSAHDTRFVSEQQQQQQQQQRNLRLEMEMIEKQTGNINLYDSISGQTTNTGSLPPTASRVSSGRQLPPNPEMNLDQQHQQPKHHQTDLFASHQMMSSPADWLPPMGITSHHLNRTSGTQFKQTMSIDHYTVPTHQQQQHYSPARVPHISEQYRSLGYTSSQIGGYESPTHSTQLPGYKLSNSDSHAHSENIVYQYMQEQLQQPDHYAPSQQLMRNKQQDLHSPLDTNLQHQQQHHLHSSTPNFSQISSKGASSSVSSQKQKPNLQHQVSSSSSGSNSQSGSLRSSNLDISKSLIDHQKTGPPLHYQHSPQHKSGGTYDQHRHGMLRKGHTSAMSGYGVNIGFSESGDLSSSHSTAGTIGGVHLTSHGGGKRVRY